MILILLQCANSLSANQLDDGIGKTLVLEVCAEYSMHTLRPYSACSDVCSYSFVILIPAQAMLG
jgi:hypothetical protein